MGFLSSAYNRRQTKAFGLAILLAAAVALVIPWLALEPGAGSGRLFGGAGGNAPDQPAAAQPVPLVRGGAPVVCRGVTSPVAPQPRLRPSLQLKPGSPEHLAVIKAASDGLPLPTEVLEPDVEGSGASASASESTPADRILNSLRALVLLVLQAFPAGAVLPSPPGLRSWVLDCDPVLGVLQPGLDGSEGLARWSGIRLQLLADDWSPEGEERLGQLLGPLLDGTGSDVDRLWARGWPPVSTAEVPLRVAWTLRWLPTSPVAAPETGCGGLCHRLVLETIGRNHLDADWWTGAVGGAGYARLQPFQLCPADGAGGFASTVGGMGLAVPCDPESHLRALMGPGWDRKDAWALSASEDRLPESQKIRLRVAQAARDSLARASAALPSQTPGAPSGPPPARIVPHARWLDLGGTDYLLVAGGLAALAYLLWQRPLQPRITPVLGGGGGASLAGASSGGGGAEVAILAEDPLDSLAGGDDEDPAGLEELGGALGRKATGIPASAAVNRIRYRASFDPRPRLWIFGLSKRMLGAWAVVTILRWLAPVGGAALVGHSLLLAIQYWLGGILLVWLPVNLYQSGLLSTPPDSSSPAAAANVDGSPALHGSPEDAVSGPGCLPRGFIGGLVGRLLHLLAWPLRLIGWRRRAPLATAGGGALGSGGGCGPSSWRLASCCGPGQSRDAPAPGRLAHHQQHRRRGRRPTLRWGSPREAWWSVRAVVHRGLRPVVEPLRVLGLRWLLPLGLALAVCLLLWGKTRQTRLQVDELPELLEHGDSALSAAPEWDPLSAATRQRVAEHFRGQCARNGLVPRRPGTEPRIFDLTAFRNELDMLELRLEELAHVVDGTVVAEATFTHQGGSKPLVFQENRDQPRFRRFADAGRLTHLVIDMEYGAADPFGDDAHAREEYQRSRMVAGLDRAGARPEDLVVFSDLDEIPKPRYLALLKFCEGYPLPVTIHSPVHLYDFGCINTADDWVRIKVTRRDQIRADCGWEFWPSAVCPHRLRDRQYLFPNSLGLGLARPLILADGGWHLTWFMDVSQMLDKLAAYSHPERNTARNRDPEFLRCLTTHCIHNNHVDFGRRYHPAALEIPFAVRQRLRRQDPAWVPFFRAPEAFPQQANVTCP